MPQRKNLTAIADKEYKDKFNSISIKIGERVQVTKIECKQIEITYEKRKYKLLSTTFNDFFRFI